MPATLAPENVRSLATLWRLRQRRHVVVACMEGTEELEAVSAAIAELGGELVIEREPGPLSAALGWPSLTVASRYGRVGWHGDSVDVDRVLDELLGFELACPECGPQAWGDPGA